MTDIWSFRATLKLLQSSQSLNMINILLLSHFHLSTSPVDQEEGLIRAEPEVTATVEIKLIIR